MLIEISRDLDGDALNKLRILVPIILISSPCFGHAQPVNTWLQPVYYAERQEPDNSLYGYTSSAGGIIFGIDKTFNRYVLGLGLNYFNATQKYTNTPNTHTNIQNYLAMLYGTFQMPQSSQLDWRMSVGINNYKQHTLENNIINTSSSYMSQQFLARAVLSKEYLVREIIFAPQINANTIYLHSNTYYVTGANTNIGSKSPSALTLGTGFKIISKLKRSKFIADSELRAIVYYDIFASCINPLTAYVIGGPALTTSATPPRPSGQLGISFSSKAYKQLNCKLSYDLLVRNYYFNNILNLQFNYVF